MKILLLDNYDSFTYNLSQRMERIIGKNVTIIKNDEIDPKEALRFDRIVLSPGPGVPKEAGRLMDVIETVYKEKPLLGVCLGMQGIAEFFGASLLNTKKVHHGIALPANRTVPEAKLLKGLPDSIPVGRYHSWVVDPKNLPSELKITSLDEKGHIMSLEHETYPIHGVQYHPESILTPQGDQILRNFLQL